MHVTALSRSTWHDAVMALRQIEDILTKAVGGYTSPAEIDWVVCRRYHSVGIITVCMAALCIVYTIIRQIVISAEQTSLNIVK